MNGMAWMPLAPVPITATRLPVKSAPSRGQLPVSSTSPRKLSMPPNSGVFGTDRLPAPEMKYRLRTTAPSSVRTVHTEFSSSQCTPTTRVSNVMSLRRSKRSATCSR